MSRFDSWPLALAYDAGRTARQIGAFLDRSRRVRPRSPTRPVIVAEIISGPPAVVDGGPVRRIVDAVHCAIDRLDDAGPNATFSFVAAGTTTLTWPDLVALAEATGLSAALADAARRAGRHDHDPALVALAAGITACDVARRDAVARRFLRRVESDPAVRELMATSSRRPVPPSPPQLAAAMAAVGSSFGAMLRDLGLTDAQVVRVAAIGRECSLPLAALVDSYLAPRTARDRLRRLWRVQRVAWRVAWILHRRRTAATPTRAA